MTHRIIARAGVIAGMLALTAGPLAAASAASLGWRVVTTVGAATHNELPGYLVATGASDAFSSWKCQGCARSNRRDNFVEHWNGRSWRRIALPAALNYPRFLIALGASSATNLWTFTSTAKAGVWNGHTWTVKALPTWVLRPTRVGEPFGQTSVFAPGNVWVFSIGAITQPTLAAHFVKGTWHRVSLPGAPVQVSSVASDDIWALATRKSIWILMHWDGARWHTLALPDVRIPSGDSVGYGVVATGSRNVWLSRTIGGIGHTASAALLHWTGGGWHVSKAPSSLDQFSAMSSDGRGGLWMVGLHGFSPSITWYLYHFARDRWTRRAIPAKTGAKASVSALAWIPRTRSLWAIGEQVAGGLGTGDILKYGP